MDFFPILVKMIELFSIIIIGYIANKGGVLKAAAKQSLTGIVLNVSLPCTILASVMTAESLPGAAKIGKILLVAALSYVVFYFIAKATSKVLRLEGKIKGAVEFAIIFSNVGFIGYPVTYAVFGAESVFYTCIFNIPFNLVCYSLGATLIAADGTGGASKGETLRKVLGTLKTPTMIAAIVALSMALIGVQGPSVVGEVCVTVGNITTPAALLIIGSALAEMPVRDMFTSRLAYIVTFVSVLLTPLIIYLVFFKFVGSDHLLLGEAVISAGMPVATSGTMLCVQYHGEERLMAQVTFLSTVCSILTIPLLAIFL